MTLYFMIFDNNVLKFHKSMDSDQRLFYGGGASLKSEALS